MKPPGAAAFRDREDVRTTLDIRAHPGSNREDISWDEWRRCWSVHVKQPARDGSANAAILALVARRLDLSPAKLRWLRSGKAKEKVLEVTGLDRVAIERRLERVP